MRLWDDAADIKILREAHHTFPFSLFTFHLIILARGAPHFSLFSFQFSLKKSVADTTLFPFQFSLFTLFSPS